MIELDMPFVLFSARGQLPATPGVYIVTDDTIILYVGQALNLRRRWGWQHHRAAQMSSSYRIYWREIPSGELDSVEQEIITQYQPAWNERAVISEGPAKGGAYLHGMTPAHVEAIRELAEILGYKVSRGPGTGQGSLAGLLKDLADRCQADPYEVTFQVAKAVHRPYAMPAKYRMQMSDEEPSAA